MLVVDVDVTVVDRSRVDLRAEVEMACECATCDDGGDLVGARARACACACACACAYPVLALALALALLPEALRPLISTDLSACIRP